jgi:hypothetical protein
MWTDPGNIKIAHRHMNMVIGAEAVQFPEKENINGIAVAVCKAGQNQRLFDTFDKEFNKYKYKIQIIYFLHFGNDTIRFI